MDRHDGSKAAADIGAGAMRQAGFTLLELLIALTLLGLVAVVGYGGLRLGSRVWEAADRRADQLDEVQAAQDFLRRLLSQAYPAAEGSTPGRMRVLFDGSSERMGFLAPAPARFGGGGIYWWTLQVGSEGGRRNLQLTWSTERGGRAAPRPGTAPVVLLRGIERLELAYHAVPDETRRSAWERGWRSDAGLPRLIRARVGFPARDGRVWPDLIVRPMLDVDGACVYDPVSKGCRGR